MDGGMSAALICAVALAGAGPAPCTPGAANWRLIATQDDARRLSEWRTAFVKALGEARAANAADVAREGALLTPDAAIAEPSIAPGAYRCRTLKLGSQAGSTLNFIAYPPFRCSVQAQGEERRFVKVTGSQRPTGRILPGDDRHEVFLGTILLGDETGALRYGVDPDRDVAGRIERIGPARWRIVIPYPRFESTLDVIELTPER
jgi:hypothetical protein